MILYAYDVTYCKVLFTEQIYGLYLYVQSDMGNPFPKNELIRANDSNTVIKTNFIYAESSN